jgi:hypothetical protein
LTKKQAQTYFIPSGTTPPLFFRNEIIRGNLVYQKENLYTTFRCEKAGNYIVNSSLFLNLQFQNDLPIDTMAFTSLQLHLYKNGTKYSTIATIERDNFRDEALASSIVVYIQGLKYCLVGIDQINLKIGDEIDVRLSADFTPYIGNIITHISTYGFLNITWQESDSLQVGTVNPTWYYE